MKGGALMYQPQYFNSNIPMPMQMQQSNQQIIRVNGENGARMFQLPANASALLLDESAPVVWLAQTDGAGYKTLLPYDITPHEVAQTTTLQELMERVKRLEERISYEPDIINSKPKISKSTKSICADDAK